jgi:predicted TIM-barrel fold metal-dependent hydrolase
MLHENDRLIDRRTALLKMGSFAAVAAAYPRLSSAAELVSPHPSDAQVQTGKSRVRKIATEEAFNIPEIADAIRDVTRMGGTSLDLPLLKQIYDGPRSTLSFEEMAKIPPSDRDRSSQIAVPKLLDLDKLRLADMDSSGVDMHVLSLTMPGVQIFERDQAVGFARLANDRLADAIRRHPTRFAGLASFAPQDPAAAVKEVQRAMVDLKLNGLIVNSHTKNEYLDEERFWPILEAAESLGAPIYIHPRAPSDGMAAPFRDYRLEGAIWGYGVETGTHILRLIFGGVLDRFPRLRIVIGHMGEALPFWMWRLDFMGAPGGRAGRKNQLKPSEYFQRNIAITTSGVEDPLALRFCIEKIGVDNIMWAIDYPYQPTPPAVAFIDHAPLSEVERTKIAHANAERIFGIKNTTATG